MPKPEWGVKRQCANCGARFYDLNADPATCPECGAVFEIEALIRGKRSRAAAREAVVTPDVEIDDVEIEGDDDAVIEDDDDADVEEAAAVAPEESEDDDLEPAEDVLLDDEVDSDEDEDLGDFGGEESDDDRR